MTDRGEAEGAAALRPGMVVGGKFALLRQIGEGGVGLVFEAEDTWIGRRVALKVLHAHLLGQGDILARFRREARAAAMTHHPNIITVYEIGQRHDGSLYLVQELLEGVTLREHVDARGKRLPHGEAVEILVPIMGALAAAHQKGIVHRDVKPENIFLARTAEGEVVPKLIDFGVAKIASSELTTLTGSLLGTPSYMSPEQASGAVDADARTDVWALGAVLFELLAGECPYEGPNAPVVLAKILTEPLPPVVTRVPGVPADLAAVIDRALERDRARRFPSMQAFLEAILEVAREPDPSLPARHARSIPPPSLGNLAEADTASLDDTAPHSARPMQRSLPEWTRPMVQPELGWYEDRPAPRAPRNHEWYVAQAGQALRVNALDEAVDHAEHAIATCGSAHEVRGQMRLIQAIALRWLGHYADSERCAHEASEALPRGSTGWYAAIGHLAIVDGYLGNNDRFPLVRAELARIEAQGEVGAPHVVAAARLAVSLVRAGRVDEADRVLAAARRKADPNAMEEPMVRAWGDVAAAEFAIHAGDPTAYLTRLEAAVASFAEAGDARNACLQRANIGNGYMQLGAYARAKGLLREAIAVGEPMRLGFIAPVRANLGLTLARLGDLEQALKIERAALDQCIKERYRRFELASRIYLAAILSLRDQLGEAEDELRAAIAASSSAPPLRANALAQLADLLLRQEARHGEALAAAEEAMGLLRALEGIEEGEALVRLVHALAREASGDAEGARAGILEARRRLLERADRITDARLRRSFLDHIPENARTIAVSSRLRAAARG